MTTYLFTKDQGPTGRVYSILGGLGFGIEKKSVNDGFGLGRNVEIFDGVPNLLLCISGY